MNNYLKTTYASKAHKRFKRVQKTIIGSLIIFFLLVTSTASMASN